MAVALEKIIRLTAQARGAQEVTALNDAVAKLDVSVKDLGKASEETGEKIEKASKQGENWKAILGVAALVAGLSVATRDAVLFESGMADVRKVVDGLDSPPALKEMSTEIISLSQRLPMAAEGFSQIYAAAGQSGIAKKEIKDFAITVTNVATAFDMTAEQAGTSLAQIKTSLGLTIPELSKLADAMNFVENGTGATAAGLVDFMTRSGAFGQLAGLNAKQTLAFGAAMTQAGIQSEIAATSFNNMVRALSRGPAMTERQIDALVKLGYSMKNAAEIEKELSDKAGKESENRVKVARREEERTVRIATEQAEKRIEIAKRETDKLLEEILRRYKKHEKIQSDAWEDEDIQRRRVLEERLDQQLNEIDAERENALKAEKNKQKALKYESSLALKEIENFYDKKAEIARNASEDEARIEERRIRDRRESMQESLEDQKERELDAARKKLNMQEDQQRQELEAVKKAAKEKLNGIEEAEKIQLEKNKKQAKKTGESLAKESAQAFADRFQSDAVGVISEVLQKISNLPKSQQLSVMSDLFGEEARGLAPMLSNLDELQRILSLVAQEQNYINSTSKEAAVRFTTSAAKLQVFNNNMTALKIAVGDTLLPLLLSIVEPLQTITKGFTGVVTAAQNFISGVIQRTVLLSVFSKAIVSVTGVLISLGIAISGVMSLVTLTKWAGGIKLLGLLPGPLRLVAVALTAIGVAGTPLGPILSAVGTALLAIQAIKFGLSIVQGIKTVLPLLGQLSVALRLGPVIGAMTTALTGLLSWMSTVFVPAMVAFFSGPAGWIALGVAAIVAGLILFREPIMEWLGSLFESIKEWWDGVWKNIETQVEKWGELFQLLLNDPDKFFEKLKTKFTETWNSIVKYVEEVFIIPWSKTWETIAKPGEEFIANIKANFDGLLTSIIKTWQGIPAAIQRAWSSVVDGMGRLWARMINSVKVTLNSVIKLWNDAASLTSSLPGPFKLPVLKLFQLENVPEYAKGGFVDRPTLGLLGEGRNPREYVIPEGSMGSAAAAWQAGLRGPQLVQAFQSPGLAPGRSSTAPSIPMGMGGTVATAGPVSLGPISIAISGGTTVLPDGTETISIEQAEMIAADTAVAVFQRMAAASGSRATYGFG